MLFDKIFLFILGTIFGSFANVLIYRIPKGISIISPSSFCPTCKNKIKFYDNIPVISYVILRGKCRSCKSPISILYPLVELMCGFLFLVPYLYYGKSFLTFKLIVFLYILFVMAVIDLKTFYIYDKIMIPGIILGIIFSLFSKHFILSLLWGILAFSFGYVIKFLGKTIFKKEALGEGDPYIFAYIGIFMPGVDLLFILFSSFFIGAVVGILLTILKKEKYVPLLPFLFCGSFLYSFWLKSSFYKFFQI